MVRSARENYANLAWEASMGGSSGFAGLFVFLFDSQWPLFCIIPSFMAF